MLSKILRNLRSGAAAPAPASQTESATRAQPCVPPSDAMVSAQPHREGPRPFPYAQAKLSPFGAYSLTDHAKESHHVSIGRDDWAPIAYFCAVLQSQGRDAASSLSRYLELAGDRRGVQTLDAVDCLMAEEQYARLDQLLEDGKLFDALSRELHHSGPREQLCYLLYALCPPYQPFVLACSREYADFYSRPENKAYNETLRARYDWLLELVRQELHEAGFETEGPLMKVDGYRAAFYDEFDIYDF